MGQPVNYTVRDGFSYTDTSGEFPRRYVAGEIFRIDPAIGEAAHQLERTNKPATAQPPAAAAATPAPASDAPETLLQSVENAFEKAVDAVLGNDGATPSGSALP